MRGLGAAQLTLIFEKYKESRPTPIGTQVEPQFTSKKQSASASAGSSLRVLRASLVLTVTLGCHLPEGFFTPGAARG